MDKNLSTEELLKLQKFQEDINQNIYELGQVKIQEYNLQKSLENIQKVEREILRLLESLSQKEQEFLKELESKYGNVSINTVTGEIT